MVEAVQTDYDRMNEPDRARYEQEHFERLSSTDKFRVASAEFNRGQLMTGERAVIIDHAYGNGDGVLDQTDMKIIEEKRNDMGVLNGIGEAATTMFETAAISTGNYALAGTVGAMNPAGTGFQLGVGGMLGGLFNSSADGSTPDAAAPQQTQSMGLFQRIGASFGLGSGN
jgi:hypothetical protein